MLSRPESGWCDITIGDFCSRASYLTNVPMDILKALNGTGTPCVCFDAEGWEFYIIFDWCETLIIGYGDPFGQSDEYCVKHFSITKEEIARQVYYDISENLDEWARWEPSTRVEDKDEVCLNRIVLENELEKLRAYYLL